MLSVIQQCQIFKIVSRFLNRYFESLIAVDREITYMEKQPMNSNELWITTIT